MLPYALSLRSTHTLRLQLHLVCAHQSAGGAGGKGEWLGGREGAAAHSTGQFIFIFALWDCAASTVAASELQPLSPPLPAPFFGAAVRA